MQVFEFRKRQRELGFRGWSTRQRDTILLLGSFVIVKNKIPGPKFHNKMNKWTFCYRQGLLLTKIFIRAIEAFVVYFSISFLKKQFVGKRNLIMQVNLTRALRCFDFTINVLKKLQ